MKRMKRFLFLMIVASICSSGFILAVWWKMGKAARLIPPSLRAAVPDKCHQLIVVRPDKVDGVSAQVWLLQRIPDLHPWKIAVGPLPAVIGKNGVGWGRGEPALPNPGGYPDKKEGDSRSPAGIFRLPFAFGAGAVSLSPLGFPWRECTSTLRGVDDVKSKYYNQVVDESTIPDKDWDSAEIMRREDGAYDLGLMISHNPDRVPGEGSCIFLHLWKGPGQGTSGCTALRREDVRAILQFMDPAREPRLVLAVD